MKAWVVSEMERLQDAGDNSLKLPNTQITLAENLQKSHEVGEGQTGDQVALGAFLGSLDDLITMEFVKDAQKADFLSICVRCTWLMSTGKIGEVPREDVEIGARRKCPLCRLIIDCVPAQSNSQSLSKDDNTSKPSQRKQDSNHAVLKIGRQDGKNIFRRHYR